MFNTIPTELPDTPLLDAIDQRKLAVSSLKLEQLSLLSHEVRSFLLYSVGKTGGHFGAGLGVVELTVALHHLLHLPHDRLVWDVGHQTYPHKILSGRKKAMAHLRQGDGISGFPKRDESEFDIFGVGHASTALSAALGMTMASEHKQESRKVVAVVGDSALGGGMTFEALSHAGGQASNLLLVLNDNRMSIGNSNGGLSSHLASLAKAPTEWRYAEQSDSSAEFHSIFEPLGWSYYGPVDGHDMPQLVEGLKNALAKPGLNVLHVRTVKGKGFGPAESDPIRFHAIDKIDAQNTHEKSPAVASGNRQAKFQEIFGRWLCEQGDRDKRLIAITPAMAEGSGMVEFAQKYPSRFFDVGIAEQHAVTLAAGFACEGMKPVVAIYSTFLQRAYDQLIHDVALQGLDVTFAVDRAGLVGEDGPTHHGAFDLTYLRCVPGLLIGAPSCENSCREMLTLAYLHPGPAVVRYPRGRAQDPMTLPGVKQVHSIGKAELVREGCGVAILSFGALLAEAISAGEEVNATVVDMRWVKPLDVGMLKKVSAEHELIVTLEESAKAGGAGSSVCEALARLPKKNRVVNLGLGDDFVGHGPQEHLREQERLLRDKIVEEIRQLTHLQTGNS
ncbi:MAG: 1-deoxy-D-xylulose-5-phosphate synthase [Pseudomonadota bacterium]